MYWVQSQSSHNWTDLETLERCRTVSTELHIWLEIAFSILRTFLSCLEIPPKDNICLSWQEEMVHKLVNTEPFSPVHFTCGSVWQGLVQIFNWPLSWLQLLVFEFLYFLVPLPSCFSKQTISRCFLPVMNINMFLRPVQRLWPLTKS